MAPFEAGRYRKLVLAAVERRGGPDASDPFELYDLPVAEDLTDAAVAARIDEVWAFWQKQRDHPKFGALVGRLVEGHAQRSAELLDTQRRRFAARRVLAQRRQRDEGRYRVLDAAIERLLERHGSVAPDKVEGLVEFGATSGIGRDEVIERLAARGQATAAGGPAAPAPPAVSAQRRRQIRDLLAEFGLLNSSPAPPTLLALLDLGAAPDVAQVRARAAAWRSRAREMPPERLRAVADELLVHVAELLEPGPSSIEAYLDAVAEDVTELLRPRVRAAVLVEDRLVADDHAHLLDEAQQLGLDRRRADGVLAALAGELGVAVDAGDAATSRAAAPGAGAGQSRVPGWYQRGRASTSGAAPADPTPGRVQAARQALQEARPVAAQQLVREATGLARGPDAARLRALAQEVEVVLAEAAAGWRAANEELAAGRFTSAVEHLEQVRRTAADLRGAAELDALLARAREGVATADRAVAAALAGPEQARVAALLAVLAAQGDHAGALAALAELPVLPPGSPTVSRLAGGPILVRWAPSSTPDVSYKVSRLRPDGSWQVVGRSSGQSLEDGGAPPGAEPVYSVAAVQAGRSSAAARTDASPDPAPPPDRPAAPAAPGAVPATSASGEDADAPAAPGAVPATSASGEDADAPAAPTAVPATSASGEDADAPSDVRVVRAGPGSVVVTWTAPAGAGAQAPEYRVRCRGDDGRWRVVGRTRDTSMEDGGAGPGELGVYGVSAAAAGTRSPERLSSPA